MEKVEVLALWRHWKNPFWTKVWFRTFKASTSFAGKFWACLCTEWVKSDSQKLTFGLWKLNFLVMMTFITITPYNQGNVIFLCKKAHKLRSQHSITYTTTLQSLICKHIKTRGLMEYSSLSPRIHGPKKQPRGKWWTTHPWPKQEITRPRPLRQIIIRSKLKKVMEYSPSSQTRH